MAGMSANESRSEVAKRLNKLDCSKQKKTATGDSPHGKDHYPGKKHEGMK